MTIESRSGLPILVNRQAGRGDTESAIQAAFGEAGVRPAIRVIDGRELRSVMHELVRAGAATIGIAGGDGTMSTAANALLDTGATLLPIPLGTFNHFAKRNGIVTVEDAVRAWQRNQPRRISAGLLNNRVFLNNASCGFYPHVVRHRDELERFLPRGLAMYMASMRVFFKLPRMKLEVTAHGTRRLVRTPALWVGIGRHSLRVPQLGDLQSNGNVLEVIAPKPASRLGLLALSFRLMLNVRRHIDAPQDRALEVLRVESFALNAREPIDVALDGEPFRLAPPLQFRLATDALRVLTIVPATH